MTRSQFLAGVFVVALFTRASVTSAQHDRPSAGSQQSLWGPGAGRTSTTTSTLTQLALELRELVPERPSLFAVAELQAELSSVQAAELGKRLHQVLGSQVPGVRLRLPYPTPPIAARKRARELNLRLVLLSPQLSRSELLVTADVIEWPENVWERAKLPLGITTHHQTLSKPVDAEVRQFLPRPPKLWSKKQIFPSPSSQVLALACGTSEGQAGQQLLVVGRRKLYLGRFVGAEFRADTVAQWDDLSPLSPNPLRTPVAGALFGPNAIYVGSSDRRDLLVLSANLEVLGRKPAAYPVWGPEGGLRCHEFSQTGLALASAPCSARQPSGSTVRRKIPSTDALANGTFSDADGTTAGVAATVTGFKATLVISPPTGESLSFQTEGWGAQVALADLDGDTAIDVITSKATLHPEEDGLLLHQLTSSGLRLAAEVSTGSVSALTVCPFDGTNPQPVIAAVGREFWVLK